MARQIGRLPREIFRNRQWVVTTKTIECLDVGEDYWFDIKRAAGEPWPLHMASKSWVNIDAFCEAWLVALAYLRAKVPNAGELIEQAKAKRLEHDRKAEIREEMFPTRKVRLRSYDEAMAEIEAVEAEYQRRYGVPNQLTAA